MAKIADKLS